MHSNQGNHLGQFTCARDLTKTEVSWMRCNKKCVLLKFLSDFHIQTDRHIVTSFAPKRQWFCLMQINCIIMMHEDKFTQKSLQLTNP